MKSDLKFLEHAGFGTVALASPTVYAESIVEGETGLLFASPEEFETKLVTLIQDGELRQRLAHNAYDWVAQSRLLSQHYRERRDWYLAMRDDLPRLNAELRERCPTMFD
jgi:glycosyltransferase involved in cell wall biosynthesis